MHQIYILPMPSFYEYNQLICTRRTSLVYISFVWKPDHNNAQRCHPLTPYCRGLWNIWNEIWILAAISIYKIIFQKDLHNSFEMYSLSIDLNFQSARLLKWLNIVQQPSLISASELMMKWRSSESISTPVKAHISHWPFNSSMDGWPVCVSNLSH